MMTVISCPGMRKNLHIRTSHLNSGALQMIGHFGFKKRMLCENDLLDFISKQQNIIESLLKK